MKSKTTHKRIKVDRILRYDIEMNDFRFFKDFFETYLTEELIEGEKNDQIKSLIAEKLPWEYQRDWVIVFGRDLAYNMQAKKKHLLIFKLGKLAFFVFQGKYLDMPGADVVEFFDNFEFDEKRLQEFKENRITTLEQKALKSEDFADNLKHWIAKFCLKYEDKMIQDYAEFENQLLRKLKLELMLASKEGFWNIFIGPRVNYVTENVKMEGELSFSLDLTGGKMNKGKKNIVMFQKKGDPEPYLQFFRKKKKEMVGFLGMLLLFLIMVTCRNFDHNKHENLQAGTIPGLGIQYIKADTFNDLVCLNQQYSLFIAGGIFFLYIGIKVFGAIQKKRKVKKLRFFWNQSFLS